MAGFQILGGDVQGPILQADKFLKCDWPRPVVFKLNLKYLHVKTTPVT